MELAIINGTYRDSSSKNSSREYPPPLLPPALPPPPRVETKMHFSFSALSFLDFSSGPYYSRKNFFLILLNIMLPFLSVNELFRFPLGNLVN
jgi:hypothetical protein